MKRLKIITLFLAILAAAPSLLHAQIIKGEVFLGGNACQVDGDECFGFKKLGVHAGVGALVPITNWMDIGLEVLFNQKGAYKRDSITYGSTFPHAYNLKLNYAEIPLMIYLTDKDAVSVGIGVSYGRLVGLNELVDGRPSEYEGIGIGIGDVDPKILLSVVPILRARYLSRNHGSCHKQSRGNLRIPEKRNCTYRFRNGTTSQYPRRQRYISIS